MPITQSRFNRRTSWKVLAAVLALKISMLALIVPALTTSVSAGPMIKVSAVQMRSEPVLQNNVTKICDYIGTLASQGTQILVFPECALTSYDATTIKEANQAEVEAAISSIAGACKTSKVYAIVGAPSWRPDGKLFNSAVVISPEGRVIERYHKVHPVEDWAEPGDHLALFDIAGTKGTIIICHDEFYPELVRLPVIAGARIIFYISSESGMQEESKIVPYRAQIQARAEENCVWLVHSNYPANADLSGSHGQSRIIKPDGNIVYEASIYQEEVVTADLDMGQASGAYAQASLNAGFLRPFWDAGLELFGIGATATIGAGQKPVVSTDSVSAGPMIKVSAVQMRSGPVLQNNVTKICDYIGTLASQGTQILVFPECALTSYDTTIITQANQAAVEAAISSIAQACKTSQVYAIVGAPTWRSDGKLLNTAVVISPDGRVIERYHKVHLVEGWAEPGDHLALFDIAGTKGTIIICHDERYPELTSLPVIAGARIVFYISCESGVGAPSKIGPYRAQIQGRAEENCAWVVHSNFPANEDQSGSHGQSRIIKPDGNIVYEASIYEEEVVTADLDMGQASAAYALASLNADFLRAFWDTGLELFELDLLPIYTDTFDTDAQGWNLSTWQQGSATPTMGWVADGGCSGGAIRCVGAGVADSCTQSGLREGGEMWKVFSTASNGSGSANIRDVRVYFDVKVNGLGTDCSGSSGNGDHSLLEEQLTMFFSTDGGATWTDAGYLKRSDLNGLQTCETRYFDLSGYPAVNNNPNFALKFRWQLNAGPESANGDVANIDNIVIKGVPGDGTPPGPVTGFAATAGDTRNILAWTNPTDPDFAGTKILFKIGAYPSGPNDAGATVIYDAVGVGCVHTGLTNGENYCYSAFAYDEVPNYSTAANASATPLYIPPPGPVTNFKAYGGNGQVTLNWTNPDDPQLAGVKIVFKTAGGYPLSPTDGDVAYDALGTGCVHTGLTNGTKYYYAAYAYTGPASYSGGVQTPAHAAADATIPEAKALANNQVRAIRGSVVTATFSGSFYIQAPASGGPYGLKVSPAEAVSVGQKVDVVGLMSGQGMERYLNPSGNAVKVTDAGITIAPAALNNKAVGGANLNAYTPGVVGGTGANNIGLLVRVFGKVTQRDTLGLQYFYIDDGCGLKDGTKTGTVDNVGIRIKTNPTNYPAGSYVVVTGIVSPFSSGGLRPQVLPMAGGVQMVNP